MEVGFGERILLIELHGGIAAQRVIDTLRRLHRIKGCCRSHWRCRGSGRFPHLLRAGLQRSRLVGMPRFLDQEGVRRLLGRRRRGHNTAQGVIGEVRGCEGAIGQVVQIR